MAVDRDGVAAQIIVGIAYAPAGGLFGGFRRWFLLWFPWWSLLWFPWFLWWLSRLGSHSGPLSPFLFP
ncbi:hypothetical protein DLJ54_03805 [Corynebacterium heidelbergense]|uniref:Uncharacterized protein n=1 Tax=Corynebacterium heidelbergense TaxID=2055947 RepID=A0A364V6Z4_9CORY|nr:hypothetical protein DLJ54_03805 [Corynebacterium heidelbergense]